MSRPVAVLTVLLMTAVAACSVPTGPESSGRRSELGVVSSDESIKGVWTLVEREIQGGPNPRIESGSQIQPSLLVYTDRHVMWAFVTGTEPRPVDADIGRAAQRYISAGGTYELDGSTLRYTRFVSLHPAAMLPDNQPFERQLVALTSDRLETSGTNADEVTTILRYTRVE